MEDRNIYEKEEAATGQVTRLPLRVERAAAEGSSRKCRVTERIQAVSLRDGTPARVACCIVNEIEEIVIRRKTTRHKIQ